MTDKGKKRLFLALWPGQQTRSQIHSLSMRLGAQNVSSGTPVKRDNLHMTLLFLGDVSEKDKLKLCASLDNVSFQPFDLIVDRWGYFQKPGIVWLGCSEQPEALSQLYGQIKKTVARNLRGVSNKTFKAHISLQRNAKSLPQVDDFEAIAWHVDSFVLVDSKLHPEGVEYTVINEWFSKA